jgi:predicted protein tyrosine phosphatase
LNWIDESVAIGNLLEANNVNLLRKENIDLVIDVRTAFNSNAYLELIRRKQILNNEKAKKISNLLVALFSLKAKVLVHCLEGVDRTPFIVMLYIAQKYSMNHKDAYHLVKQKRPQTRFHWHWVTDYENFLQTACANEEKLVNK